MRTFDPEEAGVGKYHILSATTYDNNNLLVIRRGKRVQLVQIPTTILTVKIPGKTASPCAMLDAVLEVKEVDGHKVPRSRPATSYLEIIEIDNYADTYTSRRHGGPQWPEI